jgi:transposase
MKKSGPDRKYTDEFRQAAVKQVVDGGRAVRQVARSLEMSAGTLGNWVAKANKEGEALSKLPSGKPVSELEAEVSQLRQEVARLRIEKEILKKAAAYFAKESM